MLMSQVMTDKDYLSKKKGQNRGKNEENKIEQRHSGRNKKKNYGNKNKKKKGYKSKKSFTLIISITMVKMKLKLNKLSEEDSNYSI